MKLRMTSKPPAQVTCGIAASPVGKLAVGVTDTGEICRVTFLKKASLREVIAEWQSEWTHTVFTVGGAVKNIADKNILLFGTAFQHSVWRVMAKIPRGSVTTYGGIATYIGNPAASRAVGAACGANPVPYIIPCHRVLAANGALGGFSSGLDVKKKLLRAEGYL